MNKKLVYILNQYWQNDGSHNHHILHLLEVLAAKDVDITLVIEKGNTIPKFKQSNIEVILQKQSGWRRLTELSNILRQLHQQGYKTFFIRIATISTLTAILWRKVYGGRVYYWNSGGGYEDYWPNHGILKGCLLYPVKRGPFRLLVRHIDHFVTGPETMINYYIDIVKVSRKKMVLLYNDIDIQRFSTREKKTPPKKLLLLYVKRLSPIKGVRFYFPFVIQHLIENNINNFELIIAGEGSEKDPLQQTVSKLGLDNYIKVIGNQPNQEIQNLYNKADIFVNATLEEGFPRVLIEAMASGLSVVTTDAGGIQDIVGPLQRDYMVDKKDRMLLAQKLIELIQSPELRASLVKENIAQVQRFSTENVAEMYIQKIWN